LNLELGTRFSGNLGDLASWREGEKSGRTGSKCDLKLGDVGVSAIL